MRSDIVRMVFGSHLYGLSTPKSDMDYKGIFTPTKEEILLGKIPKNYSRSSGSSGMKNTKDDVDLESYSLHYFIKLAKEGQTVALDMLHCTPDMLVSSSPTWEYLVAHRHLFYTKNLKAFVGYARQQAAKYGVKGSRLSAVKSVIDFLEPKTNFPNGQPRTLGDLWGKLPKGQHIFKYEAGELSLPQGMLEVCGRKVPESAKVTYALVVFNKFYAQYGKRAREAATNNNIDWKAVSHAIRAAYEVKEILEHRTITFPLKDRDFLLKVKLGELDYLTQVAPVLEGLMEEVEVLSKDSTLPNKVNHKFWDKFLIEALTKKVF